jgi:hypothetical protein
MVVASFDSVCGRIRLVGKPLTRIASRDPGQSQRPMRTNGGRPGSNSVQVIGARVPDDEPELSRGSGIYRGVPAKIGAEGKPSAPTLQPIRPGYVSADQIFRARLERLALPFVESGAGLGAEPGGRLFQCTLLTGMLF